MRTLTDTTRVIELKPFSNEFLTILSFHWMKNYGLPAIHPHERFVRPRFRLTQSSSILDTVQGSFPSGFRNLGELQISKPSSAIPPEKIWPARVSEQRARIVHSGCASPSVRHKTLQRSPSQPSRASCRSLRCCFSGRNAAARSLH